MREKWEAIAENYSERNVRERVLIALVILVVIYVVWDFAFIQSVVNKRKDLDKRYENVQQEMVKLNAEQQVLVSALTTDPYAPKRREIVRLEQELKQLDEDLEKLSVGLVPAAKLPKILHDVLGATDNLKFIGMEAHAPFQLQLESPVVKDESEDEEGEDAVEEVKAGIYKHSVLVEVEGDYFDIVAYLKKLEQLNWRFYWESVDYTVTYYPKAKAIIEVYTLSTERGAMGV